MERSKLAKTGKKAAETTVNAYKTVENTVVGAYRKVEDTVVGTYQKIEDAFVAKYLVHEGETLEEAQKRLKNTEK